MANLTPTLYAVVDTTEETFIFFKGGNLKETLPIESDITVAAERMAKIQKNTSNKLALAKVSVKLEEII